MTYPQWQWWRAFYHATPFGGWREDVRFEYFLRRLCGALSGQGSDDLQATWPYVVVPETKANVLAAQKLAEEGLEQYINAQGKVAHRWKPGHGPESR